MRKKSFCRIKVKANLWANGSSFCQVAIDFSQLNSETRRVLKKRTIPTHNTGHSYQSWLIYATASVFYIYLQIEPFLTLPNDPGSSAARHAMVQDSKSKLKKGSGGNIKKKNLQLWCYDYCGNIKLNASKKIMPEWVSNTSSILSKYKLILYC